MSGRSPGSERGNPPRLAEALLSRVLPPGVKTDTILGDLRQEYGDRGRWGGAVWYWLQATDLGARYAWRSVSNRGEAAPGDGVRRGSASVTGAREGVMESLWADVRYGLRMLIRTPMLSAFAVLTIGLGVGLTSHTFNSVYGSVLRGIPVPGADRLVVVAQAIPERDIEELSVPLADYEDLREQATSFEFLAGQYQGTVNIAGDDGPPERYQGGFMTDNSFTGLGVQPILGRSFRAGEDGPDAPRTILLGFDVWRNRYASDPDIVGRTLRVNGEATTVIGVMPQGFRFPFDEDVWLTHRGDPDASPRREGMDLTLFGRLAEGASLESASDEVHAIMRRIAEAYPDEYEGVTAYAYPYVDRYMPKQITAVLFLMLGATFGVLLIACANVANLLLARATLRSREVAVRTALGASRVRVIRQLLAESLVLGLLGGALGLALSWVGTEMFNAAILDIQKPYWIDIRTDVPSLLFTLAVTISAAVAAGTLPALRASGSGIADLLRDESRGSSSLRLGRFSTWLVVGELAVSCGLLIAAGLMVKSIVTLKTLDLGFETEGVLTARVGLFESDYPEPEDLDGFFRDLLQRVESEPEVVSAALTTSPPGTETGQWRISLEGQTYETATHRPVVNGTYVSGGFFETYGVEIRQGRDMRAAETWTDSEPVAVVDQSFASRHFPGQDALGRRFKIGAPDSERPWLRIVGVVPDLHVGGGVGGIGSDALPEESAYVSMGMFPFRFRTLVVKTRGRAEAFAPRARAIVAELDPNLPLYDVMSQESALQQATWAFGLFGSLFAIFGVVALFLASVGLYGVMAFSVARRRQEMGVRMALGASRKAIVRLVFNRGMAQLAVGLGLGLAIGVGLGIPLRAVTYGVEAFDSTVYGAIVLTLTVTGVVATLVPALRATRVDPKTALRAD